MYYLFLRNKKKLEDYKTKLLQVHFNIEAGKTPVFNEIACAKTNLIECFPMNLIAGVFSILGALLLAKVEINEIKKQDEVIEFLSKNSQRAERTCFEMVKKNVSFLRR